MSKENEIYRYEIKFKHNIDIKQILTMLRLNENFIFKTYPDRIVNSLYIDSYSFDCYYDNVNGNNERKKYRLRWYGSKSQKIVNPKFEIKKRKGSIGTKYIFSVNDFNFIEINNQKKLINHLHNSNIPKHYSFKLKDYRPISIISYKRSYYQAKENPIRITIDRDVTYFNIFNKWFTDFRRPVKQRDKLIIEYKFPINLFREASDIIDYFGLRRTKSSKYIDSVEALKLIINK